MEKDYFADYAVVFHAGNFYYFGGNSMTYDYNSIYRKLNSIFRLSSATWTWFEAGKLKSTRSRHGLIFVEGTFMVIGGSRPNEACRLNNGNFTCEAISSSINKYTVPHLFLVGDDFGNC